MMINPLMRKGKIPIIVQARMTSKRLPGKVLREIQGKPMLQYLVERLALIRKAGPLIVATSTEKSDDAIARYCQENGIDFHRGPLEDVALRYKQIVEERSLKAFVRICGDSPFVDPSLIDQGIEIFESGNWDVVTNVFPRSFPKGLSFEILDGDVFLDAYRRMESDSFKEHVTTFFYENASRYRIYNVANSLGDRSCLNLSVDTSDDWGRFEKVVSLMSRPQETYSGNELISLFEREKPL